jgi:nucleoid DNA-binding protein
MATTTKKARAATKSAMFQSLAERTGLARKQVAAFFDELSNYIKDELSKKGPGVVAIPGLLKIKRVEKPATKERMGRNPQTGEQMVIKAKPNRGFEIVVDKARPDAPPGMANHHERKTHTM